MERGRAGGLDWPAPADGRSGASGEIRCYRGPRLTCEFAEARPFLSVPYLNLPVLDLTAPTQAQIRTAIAFIDAHVQDGTVYVHCKIGYSRTAAVVGCWLLDAGYAGTAEAAVALMRRARPSLVVRPEAWAALRQFQAEIGLQPSRTRVA